MKSRLCELSPRLFALLIALAIPIVLAPPAGATGAGQNGEIAVEAQVSGGQRQIHFVDPDDGSAAHAPFVDLYAGFARHRYSHDGTVFGRYSSGGDIATPFNQKGMMAIYDADSPVVMPHNTNFLWLANATYPPTDFVSGINERVIWPRRVQAEDESWLNELVTSKRDGTDIQVHHSNIQNEYADVVASPVSSKVYFVWYLGASQGIQELDLTTNATRLIYQPPADGLGIFLGDVSPDGRFILYSRRKSLGGGFYSGSIYLHDLIKNEQHLLQDGGVNADVRPQFAPDMTQIAWADQSTVGTFENWTASLHAKNVTIEINEHTGDVTVSPGSSRKIADVGKKIEFIAWRPLGGIDFTITDDAPPAGKYQLTAGTGVEDVDHLRWFVDGDLISEGYTKSVSHLFEEPGTHEVRLEAKATGEAARERMKTVDVPAPSLQTWIDWDPAVEDAGRLPLKDEFDAVLHVKAGDDGLGALNEIRFEDDVLVTADPDHLLDMEFADDVPVALFSLEPGEERTFALKVTGRESGRTELRVALTAVDAAGNEVEKEWTKRVRVGHDFKIDIDAELLGEGGARSAIPDTGIELEFDENAEAAIPKPVAFDVKVTNISGDKVNNLTFDMRLLKSDLGFDPAILFSRYKIKTDEGDGEWVTVVIGDPAQPVANVLDIAIPLEEPLDDGASVDLTFEGVAVAADAARVQGIVRGVSIGTADEPTRAVSGNGSRKVLVDQDVLLVVRRAAGDDAPVARAGESWTANLVVENVSQDETVKLRVLAYRKGNVVGRSITEMLEAIEGQPGLVKDLPADEPDNRITVVGTFSSSPDGGTRAMVEMLIDGWVPAPTETDPGAMRLITADEIVIKEDADGTPQNKFRKAIDVSNPLPNSDWTWSELGWLYTDGFARGFGKWLDSTVETGRAVTMHASKLDVYAWEAFTKIVNHLDPAVRQRTYDETSAIVAKLSNITLAEAGAKVDAAIQQVIQPSVDAWVTSDWRTLSAQSGKLMGEHAPAEVIEYAIPILVAQRYVKYGGKTAMLKSKEMQTTGLLTRINRYGRKGFKPGDRINWQHATDLWGIDKLLDSQLLEYAQRKGIIIAVRDRSPGAKLRLAAGALGKIEKVKAKNVNTIDIRYLGFHPNHVDFAMIKKMPSKDIMEIRLLDADPETKAKVMARWDLRRDEYENMLPEMQSYHQKGKIPVPSREFGMNPNSNSDGLQFDGVWDQKGFRLAESGSHGVPLTADGLPAYQPQVYGKTVAGEGLHPLSGDMDPIAFLDESGEVLPLERRLEVYKELSAYGIQHPESMTWDDAAGRVKLLRDYDLANNGSEPLLTYTPDGTRRATYFDSRKSRWEKTFSETRAKVDMYLDGLDRVDQARKVTTGVVKILAKPLPREPYYGPGDNSGMEYSPDTPLVRNNGDGTYSTWLPDSGWLPFKPRDGQPIVMLPQTALTEYMEPGALRLIITELKTLGIKSGLSQQWFEKGMRIVINPGGKNQEIRTVEKLGSIVITEPLEYAHAPGELISVLPGSVPRPTLPDPVLPQAITSAPVITPVRGIAAIDGRRRATIAHVKCPEHSGVCRVVVARSLQHRIGRTKFRASVLAPSTMQAGTTAPIKVSITSKAARALTRRRFSTTVPVMATNMIGAANRRIRATIAKGTGSVRITQDVARVPRSGAVSIATIDCPAGAGSCVVHTPRSMTARIGRKSVRVTVQARSRMRAGSTAPLLLKLPRSVATQLSSTPTRAIPIRVAISNEGGHKVITLRIRLRN